MNTYVKNNKAQITATIGSIIVIVTYCITRSHALDVGEIILFALAMTHDSTARKSHMSISMLGAQAEADSTKKS